MGPKPTEPESLPKAAQDTEIIPAATGLGRRRLIQGSAAIGAATLAFPRDIFAATEKNHPLAGKSVHMTVLGISGWLPSELAVDM
ncbi:MAG: hypothetical protein ACREFZ_01615, partial [Acetobacteraceae bacterium]